MQPDHFLGVDIGGTHTRFLLMEAGGGFHALERHKTASWAAGGGAVLGRLGNAIADYVARSGRRVAAVMLGLPGILCRDRSMVLSLPYVPGLDGVPVADLLSAMLGLPVAMDKDVNHLMRWDLFQLGRRPRVAVGLYLGTGMGNSLFIDGRFYHGAHGAAGEIGHIGWPGNTLTCPCGKSGCVETMTSGAALARWMADRHPAAPVAEAFRRFAGDPALAAFIETLGRAISAEMNILDPELLILGGGVVAMDGFPRDTLVAEIRRHLRRPYPADDLAVRFTTQDAETGAQGACLAAKEFLECAGARLDATAPYRSHRA